MSIRIILPLLSLLGASVALDYSQLIPKNRHCGLKYNNVLKRSPWVCENSQFQTYPSSRVRSAMVNPAYNEYMEYLNVTKNCQTFNDKLDPYGATEYYKYESICKTNRKPVRVIWAHVPNFAVPMDLQQLNGGLLPVYVLEGQSLYDVECVHPWADGIPSHISPKMARRLSRVRYTGVKRHLCLVGYNYNYSYMCKATGFIQRDILVYSEHADLIFSVTVKDIPTSCVCTTCECHSKHW